MHEIITGASSVALGEHGVDFCFVAVEDVDRRGVEERLKGVDGGATRSSAAYY